MLRVAFAIAMLSIIVIGCVPFAPPSPLVTYGGPKIVEKSRSEVGLAVGTGVALFPDAHAGGHGWFTRYKYGIAQGFDFGIDALGVVRNDKGTFTAKLAVRYQVFDDLRLESGLGAADDSDGKSLNGDIGITWGTIKGKTWNYYASIRLGASKGYPGNIFGSGDQAPADALFPIINFGTQGKITENQRFIFEGGYGYIIPHANKTGPMFYLSGGLLFDIGG
jgi:hypothetical protein